LLPYAADEAPTEDEPDEEDVPEAVDDPCDADGPAPLPEDEDRVADPPPPDPVWVGVGRLTGGTDGVVMVGVWTGGEGTVGVGTETGGVGSGVETDGTETVGVGTETVGVDTLGTVRPGTVVSVGTVNAGLECAQRPPTARATPNPKAPQSDILTTSRGKRQCRLLSRIRPPLQPPRMAVDIYPSLTISMRTRTDQDASGRRRLERPSWSSVLPAPTT
jgi:hypothetical protein